MRPLVSLRLSEAIDSLTEGRLSDDVLFMDVRDGRSEGRCRPLGFYSSMEEEGGQMLAGPQLQVLEARTGTQRPYK